MFGQNRSVARQLRAIEKLEDDLKHLSERLASSESAVKTLQLEWVETYDKVRHQLSRMARRGELGNGIAEGEIIPSAPIEDDGIDEISRKILERRDRGKLGSQ